MRPVLVAFALAFLACRADPVITKESPVQLLNVQGAPMHATPQLAIATIPLGGTFGTTATQVSATSITLRGMGLRICADPANSGSLCCSGESAVVCTPGSLHAGTVLSPTVQACDWFPFADASLVWCIGSASGQNANIQAYQ